MPIIEVKNLTKVYGEETTETRALSGVSFKVERGEFTAIMGPSGSGKSTLLHILGMLDRETSGEYFFDTKLAANYSDEEAARIRNEKMGFIFQSFNLLARTSVLENVKLPLMYSDWPNSGWDKVARDAIDAVGLSARINHEPSQLSGGERQRAAIARALVLNPEVIFADEPTGNLDSKSGGVVMDILQELNEKKGHTIILITHETYTAEYASRIIRLKDGKIEEDSVVSGRRRARGAFIK